MTKRWIRLYKDTLDPLQNKAFSYVVKKHQKKILGILFSNDAAVSLSLSNETTLELNTFKSSDLLTLPPSRRVLDWQQAITHCDTITGSLTNLKAEQRTINIYLYIEET